MSSTTESNKRKRDELLAGIAGEPHVSAPQLPVTNLAAVLDFLNYDELCSSLLVGKTIYLGAANHVQTLNITDTYQMDTAAARRFGNVEQVNIMCLISHVGGIYDPRQILSQDTISRIIPFLLSFPKLSEVFVGGPAWRNPVGNIMTRIYYSSYACNEPANHKALFRGLVDAFCGAFKTRSFPNILVSLDGISNRLYHAQDDCRDKEEEDTGHPCVWCRDICTHFPLNSIIDGNSFTVCLSDVDRYKLVQKRSGGVDGMKEANTRILLKFLHGCTDGCEVSNYTEDENSFHLQMKEIQVVPHRGSICVMFMSRAHFKRLDALIEIGIKPIEVLQEKLYPLEFEAVEWNESSVWAKSTFDALVDRGFPMDTNDAVVDERNVPALRILRCMIRNEKY